MPNKFHEDEILLTFHEIPSFSNYCNIRNLGCCGLSRPLLALVDAPRIRNGLELNFVRFVLAIKRGKSFL